MNVSRRGLSLLEVLVTLGLISVLMVAVTLIALSVFRSWPTQAGHSEQRMAASSAVERMLRELRSGLRIIDAQERQITFWLDSNDNGFKDASTEDVRFSWSGVVGESLCRREGLGANQEILKNINNFAITYFADNLLEINLASQVDEEVINLRFDVKMRNL